LILEGDAREGAGGSGGFDAGHGTKRIEGAVDAADEAGHVGGFSPGAADLKGEDVGGVEAGGDTVELLETAQEEPGAGEKCNSECYLYGDEKPLHGAAARRLGAAT